MSRRLSLTFVLILASTAPAQSKDGNRLAYLDELNPYYPSHTFPKLITPQWVGEKDVEAVVILAIDDMRDPKKYETYLRPILDRLKKIDGRAPVSIMTCAIKPDDPQLVDWLKEGLSLECHTVEHPCPFFKHGFKRARETYDACIDMMHEIPGNKPVAFRMPCCDSMNTPSPRFYAEIFNKVTDKNHLLTIDTSVFMTYTSKDPELPKELVLDEEGKERFKEYFPKDRNFVNWIENYPYPYVMGRLCWQFPCMTPSDWQAQHRHKPFNPKTVEDWKRALDCTVIKKGVFSMVFHPHGWIKSEQVVELIDYAMEKHGKKVKFLNFREAQERLNKHLLSDQPLRDEGPTWPRERGGDNGVRLLDVNGDGYLDVVLGGGRARETDEGVTRIWSPAGRWNEIPLPEPFFHWVHTKKTGFFKGLCPTSFGVMDTNQPPTLYIGAFPTIPGHSGSFWQFDGKSWKKAPDLSRLATGFLKKLGKSEPFSRDWDVMFRDLDNDGRCELVLESAATRAVLRWSDEEKCWTELPFPILASNLFEHPVTHAAARFMDIDGDGKLDLVFSNDKEYGIYLFVDMKSGWSKKVLAGKRGDKGALPMISRAGENNGFWIHSGQFWWSNEDTVLLRDHVDRRAITESLKDAK